MDGIFLDKKCSTSGYECMGKCDKTCTGCENNTCVLNCSSGTECTGTCSVGGQACDQICPEGQTCNPACNDPDCWTTTTCLQKCNTEECAWSMGHCPLDPPGTNCSNDCEKCFGTSNEECLKCAGGKNQLFTACITGCPQSYQVVSNVFNGVNYPICLPEPDTTTEAAPLEYYVLPGTQTGSETGTAASPFANLKQAFEKISKKHTVIYLMNSTQHKFEPLDARVPGTLYSSATRPLDYGFLFTLSTLKIKPFFCTASEANCVPANTKLTVKWPLQELQLDIKAKVTIEYLIFDGKEKIKSACNFTCAICADVCDSGCSDKSCNQKDDKCYYYGLIEWNNFEQAYVDERGNKYTQAEYENLPLHCDTSPYTSYKVFYIVSPGELILSNVKFQNFRARQKSIISGIKINLTMTNVDFYNINLSNAVISQDGRLTNDIVSTIVYNTGTVSYLNNGYELQTNTKDWTIACEFRGFMNVQYIYSLTINNVLFDKNITHQKYQRQDAETQALIFIDSLRYIEISNCNITNNVISSFLRVTQNYPFEYIVNASGISVEHQLVHINIHDNQIHNNASNAYLILYYDCQSDEQINIQIDSCEIYNNVTTNGPLIQAISSVNWNIDNWRTGYSTAFFDDDGTRYTVTVNPNYFRITNTNFYNNFGGGDMQAQVLKLSYIANVTIQSVKIYNSGTKTASVTYGFNDVVVNTLISDCISYVSIAFAKDSTTEDIYFATTVEYAINLSSIQNLNLQSLSIYDNYSVGGFLINGTQLQYNINISGSTFKNNTVLDASNTVIGFVMQDEAVMTISDTIFENNINTADAGLGTAKIESYTESNYTLTITNVQFLQNQINSGGAIIISYVLNLTMSDCTFTGNKANSDNYGAVYINPFSDDSSPVIQITGSTFQQNQSINGTNAGITLDNTFSSSSSIKLVLTSLTFTSNKTDESGSAIQINSTVELENTSVIQSCTFENNESQSGTIISSHYAGILQINSCTFQANSALYGSAIYLEHGQDTTAVPTRVIINDSTFLANLGTNSIISAAGTSTQQTLETKNLTFSSNTATCIRLEYAKLEDSNSTFTDNQDDSGGVIGMYTQSIVQITDSVFKLNKAVKYGGVGVITGQSQFICDTCTFESNTSEYKGGVLHVEQDSYVRIIDSNAYSNSSADKGAFLFIIGSDVENTPSEIINSNIYNNFSGAGGTIALLAGRIEMETVTMYGNTTNGITPGIMLNLSVLTLTQSVFRTHNQGVKKGSFIYATTETEATITGCSFTDGKSSQNAGAVFMINSNIEIVNSNFDTISSIEGGVIHAGNDSELIITSCVFKNFGATDDIGGIAAYESSLHVTKSTFQNFTLGVIVGDKLEILEIDGCTFQQGSADSGGAITCSRCDGVKIKNSNFKNLSSLEYGGAIYLYTQDSQPITTTTIIDGNVFQVNSSNMGGAIFSSNIKMSIINNTFEDNSAIAEADSSTDDNEGKGGAIFLECPNKECTFYINNNIFKRNSAVYNGGAVAWENIMPEATGNTFEDNTANYANNIASFAVALAALDENLNVISSGGGRRLDTLETINDVVSGQNFGENGFAIRVGLVDVDGNIVTTDSTSIARLKVSSSSGVSLVGTTEKPADKGIYIFSDFTITAQPGATYNITVETDGIDEAKANSIGTGKTYSKNALVSMKVRNCIRGEVKQSSGACLYCKEPDFFSIDPEKSTCDDCTAEMLCYGGGNIVPQSGYWRIDEDSLVFETCPNVAACLGSTKGNPPYSYLGDCDTGYTGNLCQACDAGYSRTGKNQCGSCPDPEINGLRLAAILIGVIVIACIMIKTTMASAYKPKSLHSIYIKIFMNYLQLVMLTTTFNLDWPNEVNDLFDVQESAGSVTDQAFSVDCFIDDNATDGGVQVYYTKLIIMTFVPLLLIIVATIVWGSIAFYYRNMKYLKNELVASIIILLFLAHPNLIKLEFSVFACQGLDDGNDYLIENMEINCDSTEHVLYQIIVALPGIVIWGIGIPTVFLIALRKQSRKLGEIGNRLRFGFLFNGYNLSNYYWEFVILYRKIIIICCSVFLATISVSVQALTVMIVLLFSLHIQNQYRPYSHPDLNNMEVRSILVSAVTIYCGLYFLTGILSNTTKLIFFFIIIISNAYFLLYWLFKLFGVGISIIGNKIPCLGKAMKLHVMDGFDDDLFVSNQVNPHVIVSGKEQYMSLVGVAKNKGEFSPNKIFQPDSHDENINGFYMRIVEYKNQRKSVTQALNDDATRDFELMRQNNDPKLPQLDDVDNHTIHGSNSEDENSQTDSTPVRFSRDNSTGGQIS